MNAITDFPTLLADAEALPVVQEPTTALTDAAKIDLQTVALAKFGDWRPAVAKVRADLSALVLDLSNQARIAEAKSLRHRTINVPIADARAASKALKSKLTAVSKAVGAEEDAIVAAYTDAGRILTTQIDEAEAKIEAEKAEKARQEAERARIEAEHIAGLRGQVDAIMGQWVERCNEPDMTSERIGKGIEALGAVQMPADLADVADYWSAQQSITTGRLVTLRDELARREESARLAAERAELDRQRAEQEAERNRIAGINHRVELIRAAAIGHDDASSATLGEAITAVQALAITEAVYGEFVLVAMDAKINTLAALVKQQKEAQEREAHAAEQLRALVGVDEVASITEGQDSQQVLKAEPATADATDRDVPANTSPRVGAMGEGQAADAAPAGGFVMFVHADDSKSLMAELTAPAEAPANVPLIRGEVGHVDCGIRFAGVDPKFFPGSNPEAPQEFPEQCFPNEPAPAFDLTPDATDLLGDAATTTAQTTEQAARALLDHIAEAFTGRFPSDPKPGRAWFATLKSLACNLNDTL
ncbi:MAG: hypothetical protein ACKOWC_01420 [Limnohabitans sp.]